MKTPDSLKSLNFCPRGTFLLIFLFLTFCPTLWASQDAVVSVDEALVYADEEMTSPVGFVPRGKKIKVGNIPRNKAQVYPIIVSGKIAYIRVSDVNTQKEFQDSSKLVAERFQKQTRGEEIKTSFSAAWSSYNSQISIKTTNGNIDDNDSLSWSGFGIRGNGIVNNRWELQLLTNYFAAAHEEETFKMLEAGLGCGYRFLDWGRLTLRIEGHLLAVPWASYALGSKFRVNGSGYSTGAGLSMSLRLTQHWGIDGYGGAYYTKLQAFNVPEPYASIEPIFFGTRLGAGIHYAF